MKILQPYYYDEFKCIGDKCKSTCCAGWGVWIEKKSFLKYRKVGGEFGKFLNKNVRKNRTKKNDNEYGEMILKSDGRCPLLNDNNLCELYINSGENYLSRTCQTHPRLINQYKEDILERNLQLTCPVVAKYLVKKRDSFEFVLKSESLTEGDKRGKVDWARVTEKSYNLCWKSREFMIDIAQFRDIEIWKRLIFIKLTQNKVDELIDNREIEKIDYKIEVLKKYITSESSIDLLDLNVNKNSMIKFEFVCTIINENLEANSYTDERFRSLINILAEFGKEISEKSESSIDELEKQFDIYFKEKQYVLENYIVYDLYTYYMNSLQDLNVEKVIINLIVSCVVIKALLISLWSNEGILEDSHIEEVLYLYSKNMQGLSSRNLIYDFMKREGYDSLAQISTLLY